jgi:hypothetical protein
MHTMCHQSPTARPQEAIFWLQKLPPAANPLYHRERWLDISGGSCASLHSLYPPPPTHRVFLVLLRRFLNKQSCGWCASVHFVRKKNHGVKNTIMPPARKGKEILCRLFHYEIRRARGFEAFDANTVVSP